jgi:hypothetical protein
MEWWANDLKTYEIGDYEYGYHLCKIVFLTEDLTEEQQDDVVRAALNKIREIKAKE